MILITEFMDDAAVDLLRDHHEIVYNPGLADHQQDIPGMMDNVQALIVRNRTRVSGAFLENAPLLQCVGRLGVGLDNIDLDACKARDVTVYPAVGANNLSVAEYVVTAAMVLLRGAWFANAAMISGKWPRQDCAGREISGKTLGLIGYGSIARDTADLAHGLGMTVIAHDPVLPVDDPAWKDVGSRELHALLAEADVVSLHVPLLDSTRHLINADALALMKSDAILINAARGGVVDEDALAEAMKAEKIGGAALDVFENEPLTAENAKKFENLPNLVLTPHIAGVTNESNVRVSEVTAKAVLAHLRAIPVEMESD